MARKHDDHIVKIEVQEVKLAEAFRHLEVLNSETGRLNGQVTEIEVEIQKIYAKVGRLESSLDFNTKLTMVVATVIIGQLVLLLFKH